MIVSCATCPVRGQRCEDCVVTVLARIPVGPAPEHGAGTHLDAAERRAVSLFVAAGLVDARYAATLTASTSPAGRGQAVG